MTLRPLREEHTSARPPRVTDTRWFEVWRNRQRPPADEAWRAFAERSDLPPTSYAFTAGAVYSSHIEGVTVGIDELVESRTRDAPPERRKEVDEVRALEAAYAQAHDEPLSQDAFLRAHGILARPLLGEAAGRYRDGRVAVYGPSGIVYVAVEAEHVAEEMTGVFADVADLLAQPLTPGEALYHAALLHMVTAHIHPFADGNGRAARLLEKWFLASALGEAAWALPSEYTYWMDRARYYYTLRLGVDFYHLNYDGGGPDGTGALSFLSILPDALRTT